MNVDDFSIYYYAGKKVFIDPLKIYNVIGYLYSPSFAYLYAITFCLFPILIAHYIHYIFILILAILFLIEFDKIILLKGINKKSYRFLFLIIMSNGYFIYNQFYFLNIKFLVVYVIMFILRRELEFREGYIEKSFKYYLLNYTLFIFIISIIPYLFFLFVIYLFHEIKIKEAFKIKNIQKYICSISILILQNILFIIYPNLIFIFLKGGFKQFKSVNRIGVFNFEGLIRLSEILSFYYKILSTIFLFIIALAITFNDKWQIERKFGFFAIFFLFISPFVLYPIFIIPILLILILFIPYLKESEGNITFIKEN